MINRFTIEEVRAFWDSVSAVYEPFNATVGYVHTQRFEKTMGYADLGSGMRVLNIWSRTGKLIPYLRQVPDLEIRNREVSPKMMAIAQERFPTEDFALTDLEHLDEFPDNYFDRIISLETLEHTPKPLAFIRELYRVLKPGGKLIMSLPPRGSEVPESVYNLFFDDHGEGPHRYLWPYEVRKILADANLTLLQHQPFIILPFGSDTMVRKSEEILTKLFGKTPLANFGYRHFYICKK